VVRDVSKKMPPKKGRKKRSMISGENPSAFGGGMQGGVQEGGGWVGVSE